MKKNSTIFCAIAIGLLAFASCKKKEDNSAKAKLSGKWKATQYADDVNHNNVMDASEIVTLGDTLGFVVTFVSDGTGTDEITFPGLTFTDKFTWTLINNDADIQTKFTSGTSAGTETTRHIISLSHSDATMSEVSVDNGVSTTSWMILKKQ